MSNEHGGQPTETQSLTKWEARRLNEKHLETLKEQRFLHINKEAQTFKND